MRIDDILLESYSDAKRIFSQDADEETVSKYLDNFKDLAKRNVVNGQEKDIGKWIKAGWDKFKAFVQAQERVQTNRQTKKAKKKDSIVVYEDDEKMVVIPLSKDASCYYGRNSKWCTAATQSDNHFEDYFFINEIVLFYILFKNGDKYATACRLGRRYKFEHFDAEDEKINTLEFTTATDINIGMLTNWVDENIELIDAARRAPYEDDKRKAIESGDAEEVLSVLMANKNTRFGGDECKECEGIILTNPYTTMSYANHYLERPFPKGEDVIAQHGKASLYYAVKVLNAPFPKGEDAISTNAQWAYQYASKVLKGRFPKGEDAIASDPKFAFFYTNTIIKGPWSKGEETFATDSLWAFMYARDILVGPFPKGENAIASEKDETKDYYKFLQDNGFKDAAKEFVKVVDEVQKKER